MTIHIWDGKSLVSDTTLWTSESDGAVYQIDKVVPLIDSSGKAVMLRAIMGAADRAFSLAETISMDSISRQFSPIAAEHGAPDKDSAVLILDARNDRISTLADSGSKVVWGDLDTLHADGNPSLLLAAQCLLTAGMTALQTYMIMAKHTTSIWGEPTIWSLIDGTHFIRVDQLDLPTSLVSHKNYFKPSNRKD